MLECIAYTGGHELGDQFDQGLNTVCINHKLCEPGQVT